MTPPPPTLERRVEAWLARHRKSMEASAVNMIVLTSAAEVEAATLLAECHACIGILERGVAGLDRERLDALAQLATVTAERDTLRGLLLISEDPICPHDPTHGRGSIGQNTDNVTAFECETCNRFYSLFDAQTAANRRALEAAGTRTPARKEGNEDAG